MKRKNYPFMATHYIGRLNSLFIFLFLSLAVFSYSQAYLVHQYTESNGLPSSVVYDFLQDESGCMWFATPKGMAIYDGVSWKHLTIAGRAPLRSFMKMKMDSRGRVWTLSNFGPAGYHIEYYEGGKWYDIPALPSQANQDSQITSFELLEFTSSQGGAVPFIAVGTMQRGVFTWSGKQWEQYTAREGLISDTINGMVGVEGKLYVASENGLSVITPGPDKQVDNRLNATLRSLLPPRASRSILAIDAEYRDRYADSRLKQSRVWIYGAHWLGIIEGSELKKIYHLPSLNLPEMRVHIGISPDYREGVYIFHLFKNYYYNYRTGAMETIGIRNGLIDEGATSIFVDYEKNIWIACFRGVSKIASRRFGSYQAKHGLLEDEVTAVREYEPGKFVFGHNRGLTFFDITGSGDTPFTRRFILPGENEDSLQWRVMDIKIDSKKNTWAALAAKPLIRIDRQGNLQRYGQSEGLPLPASCLWIDPDDTLWVGTSHGLYRWQGQHFVPVKTGIPGLEMPNIRRIHESAAGFYLGTPGNGLLLMEWKSRQKKPKPSSPPGETTGSPGTPINTASNRRVSGWKYFRSRNIASANDIFAVLEDSRGRVFLGTYAGLCILEGDEIKPFISGDFKIERVIYFIAEDNRHRLWFGTGNGVVRWDGTGGKSVHYTTAEGLIGLETNRAAGFLDSQGRMWIGTNRGVSVYNPSFDNLDTFIPPLKIQFLELEAPGKKVLLPPLSLSTGKTLIRLSYKENNLAFYFRGISFLDETRLKFKTRLEGFEKQWSEELAPYSRVVRYRNLPPGRYRLHLQGKNASGLGNTVITSPEIVIESPLYQRWWFYLLLALGAGAIFASLNRYFYQARYSNRLANEIKERTQQLRLTEEKYAGLFQGIKDAVYISSPGGKLVDINPAGIELFGFKSREEILSADITRDMYDNPRDRDYFQKAIEEQGFVKDYEITLKRKNGEKFTVLLTSSAVRGEKEQVVAYRGIMRDITEKKKLEQQLERAQKMEAIGMLAGGVAHDLNNILTGLTSYPELLLLQIPKDSPLRKSLMTIKQTGEKAAAMVSDLLTLSRRGVEVREVINLNDMVRDYLDSPECEKIKAYHPDTQFVILPDPGLRNLVGSPIHLQKTIMNLVSNAAEAMPHGGVLQMKTENRKVDAPINGYDTILRGDYVVLSVTDSGVGISPEEISRIFEPFYTRKEMGRSGTGLGMSVIWATVKDHRGFIDLKTQKGKGTCFELYFPVTLQEKKEKGTPGPIEKYMGNEKILVIDDIHEQREVASGILTQLGYQVTTVASGEEAIGCMMQKSFDLLLIDMIIEKGIDGLETYRRILHEHPKQKAVIVSGFSKTEKVEEMQRLGAGIYLKKPYTIEQLGRAIRSELDSD